MGSVATTGFAAIDWAVVLGVLVATTWLAGRLAGRQASLHDFFLGGRKLPWAAVSASIVATEISAVTYVSLPSVVFRDGGDLRYLQLGLIGSVLARVIVGTVLVPAYYAREIYSPYDYVGRRLGEGARRVTTALFGLGGVLAQSARVYLTALVLQVVLHDELAWVEAQLGVAPLAAAVVAIGCVALLWTLLGGIATVVWTDAVLFLLFVLGIVAVLATLHVRVEGGLPEALVAGWEAGKLRLWDFDPDPTRAYTFWAALFAASWGGVGAYGTDQLMAQRILCCRSEADARRAVIASSLGLGVTVLAALVGVGLWAFHAEQPLTGAALEAIAREPDRVFPLFVTQELPAGLRGLVLAGVFAAAISSFDSILAALSQTTLAVLYLPWRERRIARAGHAAQPQREARRTLRVSRALVGVWAVALCAAALALEPVARRYASILDLALAMAGYTGGALLAAFGLAFLRVRVDGSGLLWSAPLSVATVFALVWHGEAAQRACAGFGVALLLLWSVRRLAPEWRDAAARRGLALQTLALVAALVGVVWLSARGVFAGGSVLAFPWYVPVGSLVAFGFGWALARPLKEPGGS